MSATVITSLANDKVKLAQALARRRTRWQEHSFIVEGTRLLEEVVEHADPPHFVFYTGEAAQASENAALLDRLAGRGVPCYAVSDQVMVACSDTVTPPGLLAVVPFPHLPSPTRITWALVMDNLRDPGNLGAILRTAAAAGVEQVLLSPGTVDPYNPKVVRGGAGAHFRLPVLSLSWAEIAEQLGGLEVWLASVRGQAPYTAVDWTFPLALIIGSEAHGASPAALELVTAYVTIPMARDVESLNAAVAAGVLLFEIARQRRVGGRKLV